MLCTVVMHSHYSLQGNMPFFVYLMSNICMYFSSKKCETEFDLQSTAKVLAMEWYSALISDVMHLDTYMCTNIVRTMYIFALPSLSCRYMFIFGIRLVHYATMTNYWSVKYICILTQVF